MWCVDRVYGYLRTRARAKRNNHRRRLAADKIRPHFMTDRGGYG